MADESWHYTINGAQAGPITREALMALAQSGSVTRQDLVWTPGMNQWQPAETMPWLAFPARAAAFSEATGAPVQYFSATNQPQYANFGERFIAAIIDGVILMIATAVLHIFGMVIAWLYMAIMESSEKQASLGKMAMGIKVTDMAGNRIGFGQATGRFFGKFISTFTFCIGYLMMLWTQRKQTLHDLMAGCLVVKA